MALKSKLFVILFVLSALVLSACADLEKEDPELKQCRHQCKHQAGFGVKEKLQCEQRCDEYIKEKKELEKQRRSEEGGGRGGIFYRRSERSREQEEVEAEEFERQQQRQGQQHHQEDQNPYFFEDEHFETRVQTEEGRVQILQKFNERSKLLKGLENYRIGYLVANPHAFIAPSHLDADIVLFVFQGRPTVTVATEEKRESHNLKPGDLFRIPAGTPFYAVNRDENQKLFIVKLMKTVSTPGEYEAFYAAGGQDPESFFRAFSPEVLQAAFKIDMNQLEKLFGQQRQGSILKASKEQIQGISKHHGQSEGFWPFHGESSSKDAFNLFKTDPSQSNQFGQLFEADFNDFKQLKDLDLLVSFANITQGSMVGPYFNSKATKISFVLDGEGYFEMACPHLASSTGRRHSGSSSQQRQQKSSPSYQKITGDLRRGTVFVAPAGHPVTAIASRNSNLQMICFEINARDNIRFRLTGKKNVVSQFDREAKELAFNAPAREVERIFNKQNEEFFFEGPNEMPQHGRRAFA